MIVTFDGGLDESPSYSNIFNGAIEYFAERELDAFLSPPTHVDEVPSIKWKDVWLI